jgi:dsRNA-specific ribonuclease
LSASDLGGWIAKTFGQRPADLAPYERALTHGSQAADNYERLEFLGDRVLGLAIAEWLFERFPAEPEGALSRRLNTLVTGGSAPMSRAKWAWHRCCASASRRAATARRTATMCWAT